MRPLGRFGVAESLIGISSSFIPIFIPPPFCILADVIVCIRCSSCLI